MDRMNHLLRNSVFVCICNVLTSGCRWGFWCFSHTCVPQHCYKRKPLASLCQEMKTTPSEASQRRLEHADKKEDKPRHHCATNQTSRCYLLLITWRSLSPNLIQTCKQSSAALSKKKKATSSNNTEKNSTDARGSWVKHQCSATWYSSCLMFLSIFTVSSHLHIDQTLARLF